MSSDTVQFQAETRRLLKLVVHSMYSHREIFLRELLANASDAADKLRFVAIEKPELLGDDPDLKVTLDYDEKKRTLTITDNGIGMSHQEAIDNLGVIAHSGAEEFLADLDKAQQKDHALIGQFGIGFYSAFIVADEVEVASRKAGLPPEEGVLWRSKAEDSFTVEPITREERGTSVTLRLKKDAKEFAQPQQLRSLVKKYMDHLAIPVRMPVKNEDAEDEGGAWETLNKAQALWLRPKKEIKDEQYQEFYKQIAQDYRDPLLWGHFNVEGLQEYKSILYIPSKAPVAILDRENFRGLRLYVRRVFIMDDAKQFLPLYLRFVRGVVDSGNLPLNVSRELLQENRNTAKLRAALTKRVLTMIQRLAEKQPDDYEIFWNEFGATLKEGLVEESKQRETLLELLRFPSVLERADAKKDKSDVEEAAEDSKESEKPAQKERSLVSLTDYVARMLPGQEKIYYLLADNLEVARNSPYLEALKSRGMEVLLCCSPVDSWVIPQIGSYQDKQLEDISRTSEDLKSSADTDEPSEETGKLLGKMKDVLGEAVGEVKASRRLTDSPSCLTLDPNAMNVQMRRVMQAAGQPLPPDQPTLEINAGHPLIKGLSALPEDQFADLTRLIYDQSRLSQGELPADLGQHVQRMNQFLTAFVEQSAN